MILQDLTTASHDELVAQIEALKAQNAKLALARSGRLSCKVTEKGGVSVYGLGRFPVTLYRSQWEALIRGVPQITAFIEANADQLASKD